jgi:nucleoid-associated protein YgaU
MSGVGAGGGGYGAAGGGDASEGGFSLVAPVEPSQGGFVADVPDERTPARRATTQPEYSTPVGVVPVGPAGQPYEDLSPPALPVPPPPVQQPIAQAPTAPTGNMRRHVVVKGDTLQSISLRYYGTRSRFRDIYAANRDVMPNEGTLSIGMALRIPQ